MNKNKMEVFQSRYILAVLFIYSLALIGCGDIVYSDHQNIDVQGWSYEDEVTFDFEMQDTIGDYNLRLTIDHQRSYSFRNLYVKILTSFPDGEITDQVVSLDMMDDYGSWLGTCKGNECHLEVSLIENITFPEVGKYGLSIQQHGRKKSLEGISGIELCVIKSS